MAKNEKNTAVVEVTAPEKKPETKKKSPTPTPRTRKPKEEKAVLNAVESAPSFKGKLQKTVDGNKGIQALEDEGNRIGLATLNKMCKATNDKEGLAMLNLGLWRIVLRISTTGTLKGTSDKDHTTMGYYCPSMASGQWVLEDGMKGKEIVINQWDLQNMSAEEFFNFVAHEFIHAYSDLIDDNDCAKNGGHKGVFVERCDQLEWIKAIPHLNANGEVSYIKWTSEITDKGRKQVKKMKIKAPSIGKVRAEKKPTPKRVKLYCPNHMAKFEESLTTYVSTAKWADGKGSVSIRCNSCEVDFVGEKQ